MVNFCSVVGCGHRAGRDNKSFYRLPAEITREGEKTLELSRVRRRKWLAAINRNFEESSLKNIRVCSDHFISGKPATLYDSTNPDWVPSLHLGYKKAGDHDDRAQKNIDRHRRSQERREKRKINDAAEALLSLQKEQPKFDNDAESEVGGIGSQTTVDGVSISNMEKEMQRLLDENQKLKGQLATKNQKYDEEFFRNDDEKVKYYTGLVSFSVMLVLFNFLKPFLPHSNIRSVSKFQSVIMTLMKLRLNLSHTDLGHRFGIGRSTVCRIFLGVIDVMYCRLKPLILWPQREQLRATMPLSFRAHFGKRVAVIIDCFEVFVERPSNLAARASSWSSYKHNNTAKYLIGVTPQGVISYISLGWGGRVSDKHLVEHCNFLSKLDPGDVVLADRGFNIDDSVALTGAEIKYPVFTKGKKQLSGEDVEKTRRIANVRIHVERVIGVLRQKYSILHSTIPVDFLITPENTHITTLDKIVTVCCGLVNMCPSVVPFN